jgi:hypothetical protein
VNHPDLLCIEGPDGCSGSVELRNPGYGTRGFARCERHGELRLRREESAQQRYPVLRPPDFDEMDAGESWDPE